MLQTLYILRFTLIKKLTITPAKSNNASIIAMTHVQDDFFTFIK
jgi:hypothetical protein